MKRHQLEIPENEELREYESGTLMARIQLLEERLAREVEALENELRVLREFAARQMEKTEKDRPGPVSNEDREYPGARSGSPCLYL